MAGRQGTGTPGLERMDVAFGRSARRSMRGTAVGVMAVFAISSAYFLNDRSRSLAVEQAWLAGLLIQRGTPGALTESIHRAMAGHAAIAGVSLIGERGQPTLTVPEAPQVRTAAARGMDAGGRPLRITVQGDGASYSAWAIAVPTEEAGAARGLPMVMLLRAEPALMPWLLANGSFAFIVLGGTGVGHRRLTGWFRNRITEPINRFGQKLSGQGAPVRTATPVEWCELAAVEARFEELRLALVDAEERADRVQRMSQFEIETKQAQFDRTLRRESDKANVDPLTRLRNRRYLEAELENVYQEARRSGQDLSVVMIDLDNFKKLNDSAGHKSGDELLRFVGELLRGTSRPEDCAARYGGDEFVLVLPNTGIKHAGLVSERLVKMFAQYASRDRVLRIVTMSAGVASLYTTEAESGDALMHKADEILYAAKARGKNAVAFTAA